MVWYPATTRPKALVDGIRPFGVDRFQRRTVQKTKILSSSIVREVSAGKYEKLPSVFHGFFG
jgi:hypothetical protein